jgi:hypothetical protein
MVIPGIFSSCFLFLSDIPIIYNGPIYDETAFDINGSMLVQYGNYIYKIGGYDNEGRVTNSVSKAKILEEDGEVQIENWTVELDLPAPRVNGAVLAVGDYLYVIGGNDEDGPVTTIFVIEIDSDDGTLGTSGVSNWTSQVIKLPEARSNMSLAYSDGRVFLIGGKNGDKVFNTILQARIQIGMSGHIGHWYTSPVLLPKYLYDSTAIITQDKSQDQFKLYVSSGISSGGYISNKFFSYQINEYGRLSNLDISSSDIPKYLIKPIMFNSLDSIIIGGGYEDDEEINYFWYEYKYDGSYLDLLDSQFAGEGPTAAQASGSMIVLDPNQDNILVPVKINLPPSRPKIYPGSGVVRYSSEIIGDMNSWNDLLYSNNFGTNEISDTPSQLASNPLVIKTSKYQFANSDGVNLTNGYPLSYKGSSIDNSGMFLFISGRLSVEANTVTDLQNFEFNTDAWYKLVLYSEKDIQIKCEYDTTTNSIALYEEDFCTNVIDVDGYPVSEPSCSDIDSISEWHCSLNPGTYYLQLTGTTEATINFLISEDV